MKEKVLEERDGGGGGEKYTKHPTALSHDFIKNWVSSKSSQDLFPQGEKKKRKKKKKKNQTTPKQKKKTKTKTPQAPSVYFLGWKPEQIQQIFTQGPSHV